MTENMVSEAKRRALGDRMKRLGIREEDLIEKFILGSGKGGQKINKTASCVFLRHMPSGIEIKCQWTRSRELNRFLARRELCDRLEEQMLGAMARRRQEAERIRRQKRRRSRRQKAQVLAAKRQRSELKRLRSPVHGNEE